VHTTTGGFLVFFLVSLSAALIGWGIVVIASRIEHQRQERYLTRHGTDTVPRRAKPSRAGCVIDQKS
jgi:hypothetical protein